MNPLDLIPAPYNLVAKAVAIVAAAIAVAVAWHHFVAQPYIDKGIAQEHVQVVKLQTALAEAELKTKKANAEIAASIADLEAAKAQLNKERDERTKKFAQQIKSLPPAVVNQPVPADAVSVLNDAVRASNAESAPAASKSGEAPAAATGDSTVGAIAVWGVEVTEQYSECVQQVDGLQKLWNDTRAALSKGGT